MIDPRASVRDEAQQCAWRMSRTAVPWKLFAAWIKLVVIVFVDVRRHTLAVAEARPRRALVRSRCLDLCLAIRVERVIERPNEDQFLVIVWHTQLESTNERVQTGRLRSTAPTGRYVRITNDAA